MELKNNHKRKDNIEAGNSVKTVSMAEGLGLVWYAGNQVTTKEGIPSGECRFCKEPSNSLRINEDWHNWKSMILEVEWQSWSIQEDEVLIHCLVCSDINW